MSYMTPDETFRQDSHGIDDSLEDFRGGSVIAYDDLIFACTNLCEVLEIENEALESHDAETVKILTENKVALAKLYEQAMAPLTKHPELAETLEPEQREALLEVGIRLKVLMETNSMRLRAEMEAYQRLMDVVVQHAKKQQTTKSTYGRAGTFDDTANGAVSLSYNKSL